MDRRRAVAELERERVALTDQLRAAQHAIDTLKRSVRDDLERLDGSPADLSDVRLASNAALTQAARSRAVATKLAGVTERLDAARRRLVQAQSDRRAVERLEERRREAWALDERRREQARLDDIVNGATARGANGGGR